MMRYVVGISPQTICFTERVVSHFRQWRQTKPWHNEAGGQLFGRLLQNEIIIVEATGPRRNDKRTPWSYEPCRAEEQIEINDRPDLVFLGDWHTHFQRFPQPSEQDRKNVAEIVRDTNHGLNGLLMVIVGYGGGADGTYVSVCDGETLHGLPAVSSST